MFADEAMLTARLLRERTLGLRLPDRTLVAASGITVGARQAVVTGLVHPSARRQGIGESLMRWAVENAGKAALLVESESCTDDADALYARYGLVRVFAENVLRHDLADVPVVALPNRVEIVAVADADEQELFDAYRNSFADRPGFREPTPTAWLADLHEDVEWRRDLSVLVRDEHGHPVGFVNVLGTWLDQVGVVPAWRGRGLGAYLVSSRLEGLKRAGADEVWLCVNVNNPAEILYHRLGFRRYGTRARYAAETPSRSPT